MSGGTINDGIITTTGSAALNIGPNTNTLSGVTLNGTVTVPSSTTLNITNALGLNGGMLSVNGTLNFSGGTTSVTGTGAISGGGTIRANTSGSTITFASGLTLSGSLSVSGVSGIIWIFQGTVSAGAGQTLTLSASGNAFINQGVWQSINGGTLILGGFWTNSGAITVTGASSTLNLGGTFTTAGIGTINHPSGTVNITGSLDNVGSTLALNDNTGTWNLFNGTISGGTITTAGTAVLAISDYESILSGVTLNGTVAVDGDERLNITNGLALNGGLLSVDGTLNFNGSTQSVTGAGAISGGGRIMADTTGSTITFASGVTLSGGLVFGGYRDAPGVTWIFQGTVSAGVAQTLGFTTRDDFYVNTGTWQSISGGTLTLGGNWTNNGTITIAGVTSTLNLGGTFTAAGMGTLNITNGTINIVGSLNNAGHTLAIATGTWNLFNGIISGGTITTAGGAVLNITEYSESTLSGVTLNGTVTLDGDNRLDITNGLALNGATLIDLSSEIGFLKFSGGSQSVTGTGAIIGARLVDADTPGATITFGSGVTLSGGMTFGGGGYSGTHSWIFQGVVSANVSAQTLAFAGSDTFNNQGTFEARNGGTLFLPTGPTFSNYSGTTLTGGTWQVCGGSKMILVGSGIATDAANIILDGSGSSIYLDAAATLDALAGLTSVTSGNSLALMDGANLTTTSTLTNAGTVSIDAASALAVGASYLQTAGVTMLDGTLTAPTLADVQGGTLSGTGTLIGDLQNEASILIGTATTAGTFTVTGAYTQSASGNLTIKVGGPNPGVDFDQFVVGGVATLDGALTIGLFNDFVPDSGTTYQVLTFASATGTFATLEGDGPLFAADFNSMDVTLTAI
jgi:hypothetical protein